MIKLAVLLKRNQSMSFEEFDRHWSTTHAELVRSCSGFTALARRYSQSHIVDPSYGGEGMKWPKAEFDGIAEVWFDSVEDMKAAFADPEFVARVGADTAVFTDPEGVTCLATEETELVEPNGEAGVKMSVVMRRRQGMSFDDFDDHWLNKHGKLVLTVPEFTRHLRRYVQCHVLQGDVLPDGWLRADFDGLAELYFDDISEMVAAFNEQQFLEIIGPDDARYIDVPRTELMTVKEFEVLPHQATVTA
jgi:uncharacterized protein (TIGR02118 family)